MALDAAAPSWRLLRAAGFTLIAAVLGVAGHLGASGQSVSPSVLVAVAIPTAIAGWWLSAGEPGVAKLGAGVLGVQFGLHLALLMAAHPASMGHGPGAPMTAASSMGEMDLVAMAAAHVGAGLLAACWLRAAERALFTAVRVCAAVRRLAAGFWCYLVRPAAADVPYRRVRLLPPGASLLHSPVAAVFGVERRGPPAAATA